MFSQPYMRILTPIVAAAIVIALGAYVYQTLKATKYMFGGPVTISVMGEGEAVAVPDIANFSFSVYAEGADAKEAQSKSAESTNAILAYLKEQGVEDKDIKTQYYNLNPRYEYTESVCNSRGMCTTGERVLRGYEVSQNVSVKVRATEKAGDLISGVGALGATDVSGLNFTIDDEDALTAEAREKAITDAEEKGKKLAESLGVDIVRMTGFYENDGGMYPMYSKSSMGMAEEGYAMDAAIAPSMPSGENTITHSVTIIYEVK